MCDTCGCGHPDNKITFQRPGEESGTIHSPAHTGHTHDHAHDHEHIHSTLIPLEQDILKTNGLQAERNRGYFEAKNLITLNLVSSPGSGKTTLLEKTITGLRESENFFVIEGDQQSMNDAGRINALGIPVIQINTGYACHLDAEMVGRAAKMLEIPDNAFLFVENVGNLVCPALFDLGEDFRVVVISVTEGDDKPLKYAHIFHTSQICVINKTDLLEYVDFDIDKVREYAMRVNPRMLFFELSSKTGAGMDKWFDWLKSLKKPR